MDIVLADVFGEGGEGPAHVEEGERHGDDVDLLDGVSADAGDVGLDEEERHGLREAVDHAQDAQVPHLLLDVVQLDGGEEQGVAPHHAAPQPVHQGQQHELSAARVPIPSVKHIGNISICITITMH